jgi:hypothetical protein
MGKMARSWRRQARRKPGEMVAKVYDVLEELAQEAEDLHDQEALADCEEAFSAIADTLPRRVAHPRNRGRLARSRFGSVRPSRPSAASRTGPIGRRERRVITLRRRDRARHDARGRTLTSQCLTQDSNVHPDRQPCKCGIPNGNRRFAGQEAKSSSVREPRGFSF